MTSSGLPWADSGGPTEYYAIGDYALCLRSYALLGTAGTAGPDGGLRVMGRSREELLGATLFGTAGLRPNRGCGRGLRRKLPGTT